MLPLILPDDVVQGELQIVSVVHPRLGYPIRVLTDGKSRVWELIAVNGQNPYRKDTVVPPEQDFSKFSKPAKFLSDCAVYAEAQAHSLVFSAGHVSAEPTIYVSSPLNPLYLILQALYLSRQAFQSLDDIYERFLDQTGNGQSLGEVLTMALFEPLLPLVCLTTDVAGEQYYQLNWDRLASYLTAACQRTTAALRGTGMLETQVLARLQPLDGSPIPDEILDLATRRQALDLVAAYVSEDVMAQCTDAVSAILGNQSALTSYLTSLDMSRAQAEELRQSLNKRPGEFDTRGKSNTKSDTKNDKTSKKPRPNGRSVMSLFKKA